jgi:hypothetical protein
MEREEECGNFKERMQEWRGNKTWGLTAGDCSYSGPTKPKEAMAVLRLHFAIGKNGTNIR